jgi:single-strand DNA-binding protein
MANFNKVILIGNLTRDPETRTFSNGGKVTHFGFAVNNRRKNSQTGQWEDEPMFIDCDAFNWGERGTLADTIAQYCRKGSQVCIEGRLRLDQWEDKQTQQKRSKHKIVVESIQFLDRRQDGGGGAPQRASAGANSGTPVGAAAGGDDFEDRPQGGNGDEIPF